MIDSLNIYEWEIIKRWPLWYISIFSISSFLIFFSFFKWWLTWWISVLFVFAVIMVSYVFLYLVSLKKTTLQIYDWYFLIKDKSFPFSELLWFNVEFNENWDFTNFIIVPAKTEYPSRYTINETSKEKVANLVKTLIDMNLNIYSEYENVKINQIIRYLKLW